MCTYKACRDKKRKGFGDFWEVKGGLTRCDIGPRKGASAQDAAAFAYYSLLGLGDGPTQAKTELPPQPAQSVHGIFLSLTPPSLLSRAGGQRESDHRRIRYSARTGSRVGTSGMESQVSKSTKPWRTRPTMSRPRCKFMHIDKPFGKSHPLSVNLGSLFPLILPDHSSPTVFSGFSVR